MKVEGGLTKVLFVRIDDRLMEALDVKVRAIRKERPGASVSRSDVARELLWSCLTAGEESGR